jgi:hypothetical protein
MYEEVYGGVKGTLFYFPFFFNTKFLTHNVSYCVAVTEGVEKATIEDENVDKKDRTVVKDKSAKLEAKLERENKKKMVTDRKICIYFNHYSFSLFYIYIGFPCHYQAY